jgi:hypothetical protein
MFSVKVLEGRRATSGGLQKRPDAGQTVALETRLKLQLGKNEPAGTFVNPLLKASIGKSGYAACQGLRIQIAVQSSKNERVE